MKTTTLACNSEKIKKVPEFLRKRKYQFLHVICEYAAVHSKIQYAHIRETPVIKVKGKRKKKHKKKRGGGGGGGDHEIGILLSPGS